MGSLLSSLHTFETPLLLFDSLNQLVWANDRAWTSLKGLQYGQLLSSVVFPEWITCKLHEWTDGGNNGTLVECVQDHFGPLTPDKDPDTIYPQEFESLVNSVSVELIVTDRNGRILMVNSAAEPLYGIRTEDMIGRTVFELEDEKVFYPSVVAMVLKKRSRQTALQTTKAGQNLVVTGIPAFGEDGGITRVVTTSIDISEISPFTNQRTGYPRSRGLGKEYVRKNPTQFVANGKTMKALIRDIERVAKKDVTILLLGETGVGKNRIAEFVHSNSHRNTGPFVEINCASIPESLIESELFGYEPGSFTGSRKDGKIGKVELANGGTLFLNEIGELPAHIQPKLLDLLETKTFSRVGGLRSITVNARIITATNRDLRSMVKEGTMRADLFYRLNVISFTIASLRDRTDEFQELCQTIVNEICDRHNYQVRTISSQALDIMMKYTWPGNIRELQNTLERMIVLSETEMLEAGDVPGEILMDIRAEDLNTELSYLHHIAPVGDGMNQLLNKHQSLPAKIKEVEKFILQDTLYQCRSSYEAAERLGVSQPTIIRKMQYHGLTARGSHEDPSL